jgi:hypothetical protein
MKMWLVSFAFVLWVFVLVGLAWLLVWSVAP